MHKKIATIFMITALLFTTGTFEMFAESEESNDAAINDEVATEQQVEMTEEEADETAAPVDETAAEDTEEPAETTEEPAAVEEAETEAVTLEAAAASRTVTLSKGTVTATSVALSWTLSGSLADGETCSYKVFDGSSEVYSGTDTSCKLAVEANSAHSYTVQATVVSGDKSSTYTSDALEITTPLEAIKGLKKVSSYKKVYLSWDAFDGAASYKVTYTGKGAKNASLYSGKKTKCTHKVTGVDAVYDIINLYNTKTGAKYSGNLNGKDRFTYTVTAYDANGNKIASSSIKGDVVKTLYYKITFKSAATLTSHSGGSVKSKFKKGQIVYARGFTEGKYVFDYKCKDGKVRTYYTMKIRVKAKLSKHLAVAKKVKTTKKLRGQSRITYTAEEAEKYVNDRGIKSNTKYMIWGNLYTQKEYIFYSKTKGKKKDWKIVTAKIGKKKRLMSAQQVSTGRATMPTSTGSTKIVRKMKSCNGTPLWNVTKYFSVHGIQKSWLPPGYPESGACMRNLNDNAVWIYNTIPLYSRVFVH